MSALLLAGGLTVAAQSVTVLPASAAQDPTSCQGGVAITNGGFEQPTAPAGSWALFPQAQVPGWSTTDSRGQIELWSSGFQGVPAPAGRQFAELNANSASRLFQDVATTPGQTLSWSLKHRGRLGTDVMRVVIGVPGGTLVQSGANIADGTTAWGSYTGTYTVPAGQTVTRFGFEAVTSVGGAGVGNFLDDITFGTGPCLVSTKTMTNLTRADSTAEVGDVLRYTVTTRNDGGNPALQSVSTDILESGIDFVPGSLRIVSGPGAGVLTDASGDDRGDYTTGDRSVRVRLGDGATGSAGGSIGVGSATSYTFDAQVGSSAANATIDNEARVSFFDAVVNQTRASTTQTTVTPVNPAADLAVTKTLDTNPVVAGEPVSFTITATNNGPQAGTGVIVTDTLPAGLSDVAVSGAGCTTAGLTLACPLPDLSVGATATLTVTGTVQASLDPGTALSNVASISGTRTDPNPGDNVATASGTVTTLADVSIAKEFAPEAPIAGEILTYTLTARNDGPSDARDVVMTDPLDPETTFVDATIGGQPCTFDGGTVLCAVGTLESGGSATATITVVLAAGATAVVQNTATITTTTSDPDPTGNAASAGFQPDVIADLAVVKAASTEVVEAGDPITFTLTVSNDGPSGATDVVLTDALPAGFDVTGVDAGAGISCTTDGPVVRCVWDALAAGASETVTVHAIAAADAPAGVATNTASVAAPAEDPDTTNNSDAVDVQIEQSADLRIAKTAVPASGVPGAPQSFVITVTNDGPSVARGVLVSDPVPAEFSVSGADHAGCAVLSGVLECAIGDLAPGASAQMNVFGTLAAGAVGTLQNTASTTSATPDLDESDNTATAELPLAPSADVSVTKTTSTPTVPLGGTVQYLVTVRNDGPSAAAAVVVDEQPDGGIRITDAVPSLGTWSAGDARWTVGTLLPGDEATLTVTAAAEAEGTLTNTATVGSATPDPDTADRMDDVDVVVTPVADLSIVKTASVSPAAVNGEVTYTLTVENHGPSDAFGVVVTDALPAELIDASTATAGCALAADTFSCAAASIAVGAVGEYQFTARVDPGTASTSVTNTARVTSTTPDPDDADNSSTTDTPLTGTPQVELVKSAGAPVDANGDGRILAGDTVAYAFTVRNTGPTTLTGVVIDDPLLGGTVVCAELDGVTLAPTDEVRCAPVAYALTQADVDAGIVLNEATVTVQSPRGEAIDDAAANVAVPRVNGISLAKSAAEPVDADGDGALGEGDTVSYSFTVSNTGTTTLTAASITDPLLGGGLDCPALDGAVLAPAEAVDCGPVAYVLTQDDVDEGVVHNAASVSAESPVGNVGDTAQADVSFEGTDAVELVKSAGAASDVDGDGRIGAGDEVPYTFTIRNTGTTTLTDPVVADPMLGALDCPAFDGGVLLPGATLDCGPIVYSLTQGDIDNGVVHNEAELTATGAIGAVTDEASADVLIAGATEIALTKTAGTPEDATGDGRIGAGDTVDYGFTIRNAGTTILSDIVLDDPLLGGAISCDALEGLELLPGDEVACGPVSYTLTQDDVDAQEVHNEASVSAQSRIGAADDTAEVDVEVLGTNGLSLEKSAGAIIDASGNGRTDAGDTIAYSFAAQNTGTTTVSGLSVSDPRLTGDIVCAATTLSPGELTVCEGDAPAVLTQDEIDAGEVVNTATVTGTGPGLTSIEAMDSITTPIEAQPAVALQKTGGDYADADGDRTFSAGDVVRFRFVVTNTGAVTLTDIAIDDPKLGGPVGCDLPDLAPGESAECGPVSYAITAAEAAAASVTNAATVSASAGALVVNAADAVVLDLSQLAVTGGVVALLPWAIALLTAGLIVLLVADVRRARRV